MATVRLLTDAELSGDAAAVFAGIRALRRDDYVNDFWRALANDPPTLRRTWDALTAVMAPGGAAHHASASTSAFALTDASDTTIPSPGPDGTTTCPSRFSTRVSRTSSVSTWCGM